MKRTILGLALTLAVFAAAPVSATTWNPTDVEATTGDVNSIDISTLGTGNFGIFDGGALPGALAPGLVLASVDTVTFNLQGNGTWQLTNLAGNTFNIGSTTAFQIGYQMANGTWIEDTLSFELGGAGSNIWMVTWGVGVALTVVDITPIPIPPALWLMASGLLGLVAMRRR